ncbi:diguanylate cyclase [Actinoplanes sp. NPDC051411]|uniref:diguanylate cyclase domain-containing protein n=1 Tax=Actinoplanes sp. NPDC051411 TaxID=3155522 RepID=UPI003433A110
MPIPNPCDAEAGRYAIFAFAAWHPSVVTLGRSGDIKAPRLTPLQLTTLTAATMIAPAILALQVAHHRVTNGVAIVIGSVALFLLVVTRMAQLVRQVERQAGRPAAGAGPLGRADRPAQAAGVVGGEEFILLLPSAGADLAAEVLARLRAATPAGQRFSAGVAVWDGTESGDELIGRADRALYAAKANGRDRTETARAGAAEPRLSPERVRD